MDEGEMEDDSGKVIEDKRLVQIWNLGGRLMLIFITAAILVCVVVVGVVGVSFFR